MGESTGEESESGKETKLRKHLQRVKRLQRLHRRVQKRLEEEIKALEEFLRKCRQLGRWAASSHTMPRAPCPDHTYHSS